MAKTSNVQVKRQQGETSGSLLRRFTQHLRKSGTLTKVRENRFFAKDVTRSSRRKSALVRESRRKEYEKMKKLGVFTNKKKVR